ncbi:pilus assembly protein PilZ [Bordetella genomosp. 1]|uniref:Pilus assembly protein PilZ n=1 Tax=Bordetella genomosp. 1 TaxID=1395607 RepID=A0A261SF91_9BORD|nr:CpaD family pilus assembly lipoprotein [Bordetella genomosp. 1]MDQ8034639.1 CpaD family pilus assembly lipoprotein [Bordetella sp.]OZI36078.1 pilus assembly protein PilZ [Bordetella genomosp. 1]
MQHATNRIPFRPALKCLLPLALIVVLAGCDTPINAVRAKRFGDNRIPQAAQAQPSAVALAMQVTPDGQGLTPESMRQANALLTRQGRIEDQVITLTPFNADGAAVAQRVAQALGRAGAREPRVMPLPLDAERMAEAADAGWDLELQSESLALDLAHCGLARPHQVTVHPYYGVGQLGCANRANLARMTTDPRDLSRPRTLEGADGKAAAGAVERYQTGEIRDLIDIDFDN